MAPPLPRSAPLATMLAGLLLGCASEPDLVPEPTPTPTPVEHADCDEEHPDNTVGLRRCTPGSEAGYTLFSAFGSRSTYLIDSLGREVHRWESDWQPGMSAYLLDDGTLLRATSLPPGPLTGAEARGGGLEARAWDGTLLWESIYSDEDVFRHHDIEPMPDGTVMMIAYEGKTRQEALDAGRDPDLLVGPVLWSDHLAQLDPQTGTIVWEWHVWDHLVQDRDETKPNFGAVDEHPERLDINAVMFETPDSDGPDWIHMNSVSYDASRDELMMTAHSQGEVWIIERGGSGDFVWRWGNEQVYGGAAPAILRGPHDAQRIPDGLPGAGNLLVFNNLGAEKDRAVVSELAFAMDGEDYARQGIAWAAPEEVWRYEAPDFASWFASGAQRLPGGNTVICEAATGRIFEVTPEGEVVWEYVNPLIWNGTLAQGQQPMNQNNALFKVQRIAPDHPALQGRDLTPGEVLER